MQTVISIAEKTRKWAEKVRKRYPRDFAPNLGGLCMIASIKLMKNLRRNKIEAEVAYNEWHAFVLVEDKVVDITATQFHKDYPPVHIGEATTLAKISDMWHIKQKTDDLDCVREDLEKTWDCYQNPWRFPKYARQKTKTKSIVNSNKT